MRTVPVESSQEELVFVRIVPEPPYPTQISSWRVVLGRICTLVRVSPTYLPLLTPTCQNPAYPYQSNPFPNAPYPSPTCPYYWRLLKIRPKEPLKFNWNDQGSKRPRPKRPRAEMTRFLNIGWHWHWIRFRFSTTAQDQDQDFGVYWWNAETTIIHQDFWLGKVVPCSHQRSEFSNTILCIFSRWDRRIGEGNPW